MARSFTEAEKDNIRGKLVNECEKSRRISENFIAENIFNCNLKLKMSK